VADDLRLAPAIGRGRHGIPPSVSSRLLGVATAAALGIGAYVHTWDAAFYDAVRTPVISQGTLFRLEAPVAALIAVGLLIRPSRSWWAAALLVAASALGAVVLYRYVDVGRLGPLPNTYEPTWALPGKSLSAWAEGAGIILAAAGLLMTRRVRAPKLSLSSLPLVRWAGAAEAGTSPLARWSTTMRRAWDSLRDFRTVRVVVRERAALLDRPREQEFLHWDGDGLELHGCFLPLPHRGRPRRPHLGEPMAHQIGRWAPPRRNR
jgi:hypothetical protein